MKIATGNWHFEIEDSWLREAGFDCEEVLGARFNVALGKSDEKEVFSVNISDINPEIRGKGTPIFNNGTVDGKAMTARERTVSILKAIMNKSALPPIEVVDSDVTNYKYKLVHGCHRLHCSIIAGFTEVPAVYGFDIRNC
jgi:uncharacterized ParB-like nuclease family protein